MSQTASGRDTMENISIHVADWIASETVSLLGLTGEAIYLRLLMHQWKNEEDGLPAEPDALRRLTGASAQQWKSAWSLIERHLPIDPTDGRRRNIRMLSEWQYLRDRRDGYRQRGGKGGQQTAQRRRANRGSLATSKAESTATSTRVAPSPSPSLKSSSTPSESVCVEVLQQTGAALSNALSMPNSTHTRPKLTVESGSAA